MAENIYWCSNGSLTSGQCCFHQDCESGLTDPICSYELDHSPLKRFICPQSVGQCGSDKVFTAAYDGTVRKIKPGYDNESKFKSGSTCSYQIKFPEEASYGDTFKVILDY